MKTDFDLKHAKAITSDIESGIKWPCRIEIFFKEVHRICHRANKGSA